MKLKQITNTELIFTGSIEKGLTSADYLDQDENHKYGFILPKGVSFRLEKFYSTMNSITICKSGILSFGICEKEYFSGLYKEVGSSGIVESSLSINGEIYLALSEYQPFFFNFKNMPPDTDIVISLIGKISRPVA